MTLLVVERRIEWLDLEILAKCIFLLNADSFFEFTEK
jgi:hypothetical protein